MKETTKDRLKELAESLGITQADMCKKTQIPKSTMSLYWSGKRLPKQNNLTLIAQAYNVSETWLMGYDVPMEKQSITEAFNLEQAGLLSQIRKRPKVQEAVIELLKLSDEDIEFYTENFKRMNRGKE
mgnify:CR=1 FL=1